MSKWWFWYQLKGRKTRPGKSVCGGAYAAMMVAIRKDATPNLYFLYYDLATLSIRNLLLGSSFAFPPEATIKRKPLPPSARLAGWMGCNLDLSRVPAGARIEIIKTCGSGRESAPPAPTTEDNQSRLMSPAIRILPPGEVRPQFRKVKPLGEIKVTERSRALDVLNAVGGLAKPSSLLRTRTRSRASWRGYSPTIYL
jgi:hypothetical protein